MIIAIIFDHTISYLQKKSNRFFDFFKKIFFQRAKYTAAITASPNTFFPGDVSERKTFSPFTARSVSFQSFSPLWGKAAGKLFPFFGKPMVYSAFSCSY